MKKLTAIVLMLALILTLAACNFINDVDEVTSGFISDETNSQREGDGDEVYNNENEGESIPEASPEVSETPQTEVPLTLLIAKGYGDCELLFHITVPGLQDIRADDPDPSIVDYTLFIYFADYQLAISPLWYREGYTWGNVVRLHGPGTVSYQNEAHYEWFSADGFSWYSEDGDNILVSVRMPEDDTFNLDNVNEFEVTIRRMRNGVAQEQEEDYSFNRADVTVPREQILSVTPFSEFHSEDSLVSLHATDNGDGTMTFTLVDSAVKPVVYYYPWSWVDNVFESSLRFNWVVSGIDSYNPLTANVVIGSKFGVNRYMGLGDFVISDKLPHMTLNFEREIDEVEGFQSPPTDSKITVDENGLTVIWTQKFASGYSLDDVAVFTMDIQYLLFGQDYEGNEVFLFNDYLSYFIEVDDILK